MSLLDKIIYIADYIEPNRNVLPEMDVIRREAYTDIDVCLLHILKNSVEYLDNKGELVDPATRETYKFYLKKQNKEC